MSVKCNHCGRPFKKDELHAVLVFRRGKLEEGTCGRCASGVRPRFSSGAKMICQYKAYAMHPKKILKLIDQEAIDDIKDPQD